MRKLQLWCLLTLIIVLCGYGKKEEPVQEPKETQEVEVFTEPDTENAEAQSDQEI